MTFPTKVKLVLLVGLICNGALVAASSTIQQIETTEQAHSRAITEAQHGRLSVAIKILEGLYLKNPDTPKLWDDYLVVLVWAQRYQLAADLASKGDLENAPLYVVEAAAIAARHIKDFSTAEKRYELLLKRSSKSQRSHVIGLALTYADMGRFSEGHRLLSTLVGDQNNNTELKLAEAYLRKQEGDLLGALTNYEHVLALEPSNREALRGEVSILQRLRLSQFALKLMERYPDYFSRSEINHMNADVAASWIRMGKLSIDNRLPNLFAETDRALHLLDRHLQRFPPGSSAYQRTQFDHIVALVHRRSYQSAVNEYEQLASNDTQIPDYVLQQVSRAYLQMKQPEKAKDILTTIVQRTPEDFEARVELIYVDLELQEFSDALALVDDLVISEPVWRSRGRGSVVKENPRRLQAEILAALARGYADDLVNAQERLEKALAQAPHNTDIRQELANIYRWRGWSDRALEHYKQAIDVEPKLLSAQNGYTHTLLDRRHYRAAEISLGRLEQEFKDDSTLSDLGRRWQVHNMWEFLARAFYRHSSGGSFGTEEYQADTFLYSPPLHYRYRVYTHSVDAFAKFPEGDGNRHRIGIGTEYRGIDWTHLFELSTSYKTSDRHGFSLNSGYRIDDYWSLAGSAQIDSNEIPLRAHRTGIETNLYKLSGRFRASELWNLGLAVSAMDFDDGNDRQSILLDGTRSIVNKPKYKLSLLGDLYASRNSRQDVIYFSPSADASFTLTLDNLWTPFRRYHKAFQRRLAVSSGLYSQSGFGVDINVAIEYEHIHVLSQTLGFNYGLHFDRAVYDGDAEYSIVGFGSINWRF